MPKNSTAPRNYVAEVVYRNTLDDDDSDDVIAQFILPHEDSKYRELIDNIQMHRRYIVSASLTPVK